MSTVVSCNTGKLSNVGSSTAKSIWNGTLHSSQGPAPLCARYCTNVGPKHLLFMPKSLQHRGVNRRYFTILLRPCWLWCWTREVKIHPHVTLVTSVHSYHNVFGSESDLARAGPALSVKHCCVASPKQLLRAPCSQLAEYRGQVTSVTRSGLSCEDQ